MTVPNAATGKDAADNVTAAAAGFRKSTPRDYTLRRSSPACEAGAWLDWMTDTSIDLAHRPRRFGHNVDMGCYENHVPFASVILVQ